MELAKKIGAYIVTALGAALLTVAGGVSDSVRDFLLLPVRCMAVAESAQNQAEAAYNLAATMERRESATAFYSELRQQISIMVEQQAVMSEKIEKMQYQQAEQTGYLKALNKDALWGASGERPRPKGETLPAMVYSE